MCPGELLLFFMTSTCVYSVVDLYVLEAHENGTVTLEWKVFPGLAVRPMDISCHHEPSSNLISRGFFQQFQNKEDLTYQDNRFRGRVQVDPSHLRAGLFRANLSNLHLNDSGLYSCIFYNSEGRDSSDCGLSVTTAPAGTSPPRTTQRQTEAPVESRQRPGLYAALGLFCLLIVVILMVIFSAAPNKPPSPV